MQWNPCFSFCWCCLIFSLNSLRVIFQAQLNIARIPQRFSHVAWWFSIALYSWISHVAILKVFCLISLVWISQLYSAAMFFVPTSTVISEEWRKTQLILPGGIEPTKRTKQQCLHFLRALHWLQYTRKTQVCSLHTTAHMLILQRREPPCTPQASSCGQGGLGDEKQFPCLIEPTHPPSPGGTTSDYASLCKPAGHNQHWKSLDSRPDCRAHP